jgi:hypothetical protein
VTVEYRLDPAQTAGFQSLMATRRLALRRHGARRWSLLQDLDDPRRWIERFQFATWGDCLRHGQRMTKADQDLEERIAGLTEPGTPPRLAYLIGHRPDLRSGPAADPLLAGGEI